MKSRKMKIENEKMKKLNFLLVVHSGNISKNHLTIDHSLVLYVWLFYRIKCYYRFLLRVILIFYPLDYLLNVHFQEDDPIGFHRLD